MNYWVDEAAWEIWTCLYEHGVSTAAELSDRTGFEPDLVQLGIGWLVREGKLDILVTGRGEEFCLRVVPTLEAEPQLIRG